MAIKRGLREKHEPAVSYSAGQVSRIIKSTRRSYRSCRFSLRFSLSLSWLETLWHNAAYYNPRKVMIFSIRSIDRSVRYDRRRDHISVELCLLVDVTKYSTEKATNRAEEVEGKVAGLFLSFVESVWLGSLRQDEKRERVYKYYSLTRVLEETPWLRVSRTWPHLPESLGTALYRGIYTCTSPSFTNRLGERLCGTAPQSDQFSRPRSKLEIFFRPAPERGTPRSELLLERRVKYGDRAARWRVKNSSWCYWMPGRCTAAQNKMQRGNFRPGRGESFPRYSRPLC